MPALKISKISRAAFAPFGEVIMLDGAQEFSINEGTSQRFHALATADTSAQNGQTILSLFRAQPRTLPLKISM
ncbi:MAG: ureidoglycolate lyase, partial [Burkholderiaceae bacterium]|nr:ureidoglycolate lyase [Burkholderiaceae bacterium]